jgi:WD40-like Beta Propeller Repeat
LDVRTPRGPRSRLLACFAAAALAALAACSDSTTSPDPVAPPAPGPGVPGTAGAAGDVVATVRCTVNLRASTERCANLDVGSTPVQALRTIGGADKVQFLFSNRVKTQTSYQMDIRFKNLMVQRMGSNGVTVNGTTVYLATGPTAVVGTGTVQVDTPIARADFGGAETNRPYHYHTASVGYLGMSGAKRWRFTFPSSVDSITFTLKLVTELVPVVVFDRLVGGQRDIWRVGLDGNDLTQLTTHTADDRDPTVADGKVVFVSYRHGNADLFSVPLVGGAETRLTTSTADDLEPTLSVSGAKIAFTRVGTNGLSRLYTATASGTGTAAATTSFAAASDIEVTPAWGNNDRLYFASTHEGATDVWDMTTPGATPAFTTGLQSSADLDPAPGRSGSTANTVIFASDRAGDTELFQYQRNTGVVTQLTSPATRGGIAGSNGSPSWAKGFVVYSCGNKSVVPTVYEICFLRTSEPATVRKIPGLSGDVRRPFAYFF